MSSENWDAWSPVRRGGNRQKHGPIKGLVRNSQLAVDTHHENRAGHRFYVRHNQNRQFRKNIVGFGRWRKHNERRDESWAHQTAVVPIEPRRYRRLDMLHQYRMHRKNRRANAVRKP